MNEWNLWTRPSLWHVWLESWVVCLLERLTGITDLLGGAWSCLVVSAWSTGLDWVSGTAIPESILRCMRVNIDIKSTKVTWLMLLRRDGNIRLLTSETMEVSCLATGVVPAGVSWPADPPTLTTCWVLILCWVGNNCWVIHNLWLVLHCGAEIHNWLITCWVLCLCRVRRARHTCWVSQSWQVC